MKFISFSFFILLFFSCGKDKSVLLPEIENAKISKVLDVSPAYLFYDETQPDSIELNRKNLIGTTNWLFNVDKRLTLEQAIPKIKFLQDKKRNAQMHKNENAKNYYTCNDTSIRNLGFIEFTKVNYRSISIQEFYKDKPRYEKMSIGLNVIAHNQYSVELQYNNQSSTEIFTQFNDVHKFLIEYFKKEEDIKLYLMFNSDLNFQDYISIISKIQEVQEMGISIDHNEFIY